MDDIDDILRTLGMETTPSTQQVTAPLVSADNSEVTSTETFSEDDISDILQDNGFTTPSADNSYDENQGEGNDDYYLEDEDAYEDLEPDETSTEASEAEEETTTESNLSFIPSEGNEEPSTENPTIPLNSPTLLIDETTTRFSGTQWFSEIQKSRIIIAGVGGIGSNVAFQLARMVPTSITLYDPDTVDAVNMAGQLYKRTDIGTAKVNAIASMISEYTNLEQIYAIPEKFTNLSESGDIMICGFDNMLARNCFYQSWLRHTLNKPIEERENCIFIDGRLSIDTLQIFCIRGDDDYNISRYNREFLFTDAQADETICSMKQTTYLACMIGSLMVNLFTNFIANKLAPIIPYDIPFFTEYDAQNMIFKTEN